ncbi:ATP phosphoribosyltransferase [Pyrococcus furiosus DSM 3638]|uniref:ATP phosphoribosyltransferase n=3 Tax=Pyrococcus furiosus TaxID=2261 RepID=HIS1_PYRFU|nr:MULTISPECIES: ATP phosphoribosyltransferase [Pyrococcus]Q8U0D4.1 RecName: Full=ATP phosphoribosyltransferase; Short=ATP-PRT; Short=ATP-PRTase [Pyrococcus furiosus DSM 3638]AAL81782.1 ATP phosphoribosyltransferase [Pyrococcus furiosus DSM 3638]AFN04982.1 ATP phosphoribosyltransferase catalytic subunit [Pyrococcus furiosus COM1]MDK2869476.1 phosphoribosyltransferase [Pyrococcus sp.]QEK79279.1 ATP phosphoribosyltransferase [Pyrococcus furiosus DSM 3638]
MRFVLPKGRLYQDSIKVLELAGIKVPKRDERALIWGDGNNEFLLARAFDVPVYVEHGIDIGIAGSDVVEERGSDVFIPLELPFGKCRLSIAVPKEKVVDPENMDGYKIATKYPNITKRYFENLNIEVEVIKLHGSIELAPRIGIADAIVDIVETGNTLRSNGLVEVAKIMDVSALLLVNRISQKMFFEEINSFITKIRRSVYGH